LAPIDATDDRLVRFLLGRLPIAEREAIERACLREDDSAFAELVALEDELRFLYVSGDLPPADRRAFEARYLRTLSDRARLIFARALAAIAADPP
jgi:anti-sigma factor RsiW